MSPQTPCAECGADFDPCYCNAPIVCPGCYSVGEEPCAPDCIDAKMARARDEQDPHDDADGGLE